MVDEDGLQRAVDVAFARLAREGYEALAPAQRILVCVWAACGEIDWSRRSARSMTEGRDTIGLAGPDVDARRF